VVAIRGTATQYDWLSNLNTAVERGPGGQLVHAGFHRVSQTIVGVISTALRGTNPSKLHVVGHSLGGAVANLIAARLHVDRVADIELYTFGAPRAGLGYFASGLTRDLSARQIHRVYNLSDAVPMVPLHPLRHAPAPGDGVRVRTPHGLVSIDAHLMRAYTSAVSNQTWPQLSVASRDLEDLLTVDHWIQRATENTRFPGSSYALYALGWALKGLLDMARDQLGAAIVAHMTLLDRLAWLLHRAAEASLALGERLLALMRAVLRFAGRTLAAGATLSAAFISYVLGLLIRPLAAIAHMALERVAMEG